MTLRTARAGLAALGMMWNLSSCGSTEPDEVTLQNTPNDFQYQVRSVSKWTATREYDPHAARRERGPGSLRGPLPHRHLHLGAGGRLSSSSFVALLLQHDERVAPGGFGVRIAQHPG